MVPAANRCIFFVTGAGKHRPCQPLSAQLPQACTLRIQHWIRKHRHAMKIFVSNCLRPRFASNILRLLFTPLLGLPSELPTVVSSDQIIAWFESAEVEDHESTSSSLKRRRSNSTMKHGVCHSSQQVDTVDIFGHPVIIFVNIITSKKQTQTNTRAHRSSVVSQFKTQHPCRKKAVAKKLQHTPASCTNLDC